MSQRRSITEALRGLQSQHPDTIPVPPLRRPPQSFGAPRQSALCLQLDPGVRDQTRCASGLLPGRRAHRVPTSRLPAAASPPSSPQTSENESVPKPRPLPSASSRRCSNGLVLRGRGGDYPSVAPCYALASPSFLAAASKAQPRPSAWAPSLAHESPPQGPLGALRRRRGLRAPRPSWRWSRDGRTAQPSPRPPPGAPRSCHPAAALLRALGLSSPDPRRPWHGGGGRQGPRVLTPPQDGAARRRMSGAWAAAGSRAGGCVRPRADPVPRGAMPPALGRPPPSAPRSLRPPPVAPGASPHPPPPPPPAPPRLSSTPRCVPIPAPTSAVAAPRVR